MSLKNTIKKNLIETKEVKKQVLTESMIVKNRFNFILESNKIKNKKDLDKVFVTILTEMVHLHKQGFDNSIIEENVSSVFNVLGNLFGGTTNAVIELFKEKGVKFILEKLGIEDNNFLKNFLITALGNTDMGNCTDEPWHTSSGCGTAVCIENSGSLTVTVTFLKLEHPVAVEVCVSLYVVVWVGRRMVIALVGETTPNTGDHS